MTSGVANRRSRIPVFEAIHSGVVSSCLELTSWELLTTVSGTNDPDPSIVAVMQPAGDTSDPTLRTRFHN